jgi:hypothetical protein
MIETGPVKVELVRVDSNYQLFRGVKNILLKEQAEEPILHVLLSMAEIR